MLNSLRRFFSPTLLWSVICALFYILSYPPVNWWPLSILAFSLFSWLMFESQSKPQSFGYYFKHFFVFTFVIRLTGLYWVPHTFIEFAGFPLIVAWLAGIGVFLIMAFTGALAAGFLIPRCLRIQNKNLRVLAIFAFWMFWDFVDYRFFPWAPVQSFGAQKYLLASAAVLGTIGWNIIFYLMTSLIHVEWTKNFSRRVALWCSAWIVVLLVGGVCGHFQIEKLRAKYSKNQKVALLQGNVGNFEKKIQTRNESPTHENVLRIYRDLIESLALKQKYENLGELFVFWPETAFPGFPLNDSSLSALLSSWAKITKAYHLIGAYEEAATTVDGKTKMSQYNVVTAYGSNGEFQGHYRKVVRMPFGEYVPGDEYYPGIYEKFPFLNNFGKGARPLALPHTSPTGPVFLPFICFEILDEAYVKEAVRLASIEFPGRDLVLINPTNDSWFGEGAELFLHSHLALWQVARAGLPFVRPTNTGISMVVAPWGEILAQGRVGVEMTIFTDLPLSR